MSDSLSSFWVKKNQAIVVFVFFKSHVKVCSYDKLKITVCTHYNFVSMHRILNCNHNWPWVGVAY